MQEIIITADDDAGFFPDVQTFAEPAIWFSVAYDHNNLPDILSMACRTPSFDPNINFVAKDHRGSINRTCRLEPPLNLSIGADSDHSSLFIAKIDCPVTYYR